MKYSAFSFKIKYLLTVTWIVAGFIFAPASSFALGVGNIELSSTLNQKLDATIDLLGVQEDEIPSIKVNLAPDAVYLRMGIERNKQLEQLKFTIEKNDEGSHFIHVSTDKTVTEPFLSFLIELNWSNGRLLREFTVLLDPPVLLTEKPDAIQAPQADLPPSFTVTKDTKVGEVAEAIKTQKVVVAEEPVENIEPTEKNVESSPADDESFTMVEEQTPTEPQMASGSLVYDKVKKNEMLWNIANDMRPDNISIEQMMLALKSENPGAFYGDNVSYLKAGAVLRIEDTSSLTDISAEDASIEVSRQYREWLNERRERQAENAVAVESTSTAVNGESEEVATTEIEVAPSETVAEINLDNEPRLKLVSPIEELTEDTATQTNAVLEAATDKLTKLNVELAVASESVEAGKRENEELLTRLSALQEQMSEMQSLIQLKDAELQLFQETDGVENPMASSLNFDAFAEDGKIVETPVKETHEHEPTKTSLWTDPVTISTAIFSILLLMLLAWFIRGRRTVTIEQEEVAYTDEKQKSLDELFPDKETETSVIKFNESITETADSNIGIEPLTEITFENTEILDAKESLLDPIAEADVYLTYEKYEKAEDLLKDAIEADPGRQELKLKLLEVYALSRNIDNFDKQAEQLYAAILGDEEGPLWQNAVLMAHDIDTKSPLFQSVQVSSAVKPELEEVEIDNFTLPATSPEVTSFEANPPSGSEEPALEEILVRDVEKTNREEVNVPIIEESKFEDIPVVEVASTEVEEIAVAEVASTEVEDTAVAEDVTAELEDTAVAEDVTEELDEVATTEAEDIAVVEVTTSDDDDVVSAEVNENKKDTEVDSWSPDKVTEFEAEHQNSAITDTELEIDSTQIVEPIEEEQVSEEELAEAVETTEDTFADEVLDQDWDEVNGEKVNEIVNEAIENAVQHSSKEATAETKVTDNSLFLLSDEVGTKLDLAKAYIEMGDHEGALDLLGEVLEEGTIQQKNEARLLMEDS